MALRYLKVSPEEALRILDECITSGYAAKDKISKDYSDDKKVTGERIDEWHKTANGWANGCIQKLTDVFVSTKEAYQFRDAQVPFGATSENVNWFGIIQKMQARLGKLAEYDKFIRDHFNVRLVSIKNDHWYQTLWGKILIGIVVAVLAAVMIAALGLS